MKWSFSIPPFKCMCEGFDFVCVFVVSGCASVECVDECTCVCMCVCRSDIKSTIYLVASTSQFNLTQTLGISSL